MTNAFTQDRTINSLQITCNCATDETENKTDFKISNHGAATTKNNNVGKICLNSLDTHFCF